jgi:Fungal family of unknown function (DUF1776)
MHPFVHSVISLLSLSSFSTPVPFEHVQLQGEYLKYLNATHITPLQIIQALMPLMRNSPSRTRDAIKNGKGKKSIVVCIPILSAYVGFPFLGPSSVSAAATLRAVDVLRREVRVAASTGGAEGMNDIEVVSLEVGQLDIPPFACRPLDYDPKEYAKSWTPSEKLAYGPAWDLLLEANKDDPSVSRGQSKAQKVEVFVGDLVQIVSHGRVCCVSLCGLRLHIGSTFDWLRGGRYAVGSGGKFLVFTIPGETSPYQYLHFSPFRSFDKYNHVTTSWCSARHHYQHPVLHSLQGSTSGSHNCIIYTCSRASAPARARATSSTYCARSPCDRGKGNY